MTIHFVEPFCPPPPGVSPTTIPLGKARVKISIHRGIFKEYKLMFRFPCYLFQLAYFFFMILPVLCICCFRLDVSIAFEYTKTVILISDFHANYSNGSYNYDGQDQPWHHPNQACSIAAQPTRGQNFALFYFAMQCDHY